MSLFRIGGNTQAMNALRSLNKVNKRIGVHQRRLSTGKLINSAQDDTAGYAIANSLKARASGLKAALNNVSNARNILAIAEGGYQAQMDILQTIKDKAVQASDGSLSDTQRQAIQDQVEELLKELDDIQSQTKWNGNSIMDGSANGTFTFHVGADNGDTMSVTLDDSDSAAIGNGSTDLSVMASTGGNIALESAASASAAITSVDSAIDDLAKSVQDVGDKLARLTSKEDTLAVSITNTDAVRSTYEDADFAREQLDLMKMQILQQTAVTGLGQANAAPQVVLSLFN